MKTPKPPDPRSRAVWQEDAGAWLYAAYSGVTRFDHTRWQVCGGHSDWVLDVITHGQQSQRVGRGRPFMRPSDLITLYANRVDFYEWRDAGGSIDEAFIYFDVRGEVERELRRLTGRAGYCRFRDPQQLVGDGLRKLSEVLIQRRPGHALVAHGVFLQLLGLVIASEPVGQHLRVVRQRNDDAPPDDLRSRVEHYIRTHLDQRILLPDLARHVRLSPSGLAHAYTRQAGESPGRAVRRLKIAAAKRLMVQEGWSVKQTALHLGFTSEFDFSRTFKRLEGIAPHHYHQRLASKSMK